LVIDLPQKLKREIPKIKDNLDGLGKPFDSEEPVVVRDVESGKLHSINMGNPIGFVLAIAGYLLIIACIIILILGL
jgi:hypothetical protein